MAGVSAPLAQRLRFGVFLEVFMFGRRFEQEKTAENAEAAALGVEGSQDEVEIEYPTWLGQAGPAESGGEGEDDSDSDDDMESLEDMTSDEEEDDEVHAKDNGAAKGEDHTGER